MGWCLVQFGTFPGSAAKISGVLPWFHEEILWFHTNVFGSTPWFHWRCSGSMERCLGTQPGYFNPTRGAKYCNERVSVCLSVRLSVCLLSYLKKRHVQTSWNFLHVLTMVVARSSSDDSVIRYVLPVLRMTSHFHVTGVGNNDLGAMLKQVVRRIRQEAPRCLALPSYTVQG